MTQTLKTSTRFLQANRSEDTAANKRDETWCGKWPVEDESWVQALLTHEVAVRQMVVSFKIHYTFVSRFTEKHQSDHQTAATYQSSLASAVSPAMEMPTWLSTCRIFFWWAASSDWALCRNRKTISTQGSPPLMDEFSSNCCFNPVSYSTVTDFTFNATRTAWVLDLSPTVAEPCFTASMAYSIWWIRPWNRNRMVYVWTFTTVVNLWQTDFKYT